MFLDVTERRRVTAGGAEFYVEVSDAGGPTTIRDAGPLSFDGVRATVEGIATDRSAGIPATIAAAGHRRWQR